MAAPCTPFAPESVPRGLDGLTAELIADLYDCAAKFGLDAAGVPGLRRLTFASDPPVFVSVCVPPSRFRHVMVSAIQGGVPPDAHAVPLGDDMGHATSLRWDRAVSVDDVRRGIAACDRAMRERGGFDPSGRRLRVESDARSAAKLPVDRIFSERGKKYVLHGCFDPDEGRGIFDRPDDVIILGTTPDGLVACHRRDAVRREEYERAVEAVLARRGISRHEDVERLSGADLRAMMAEIDEELRKLPE